jgi:hypothetical protein
MKTAAPWVLATAGFRRGFLQIITIAACAASLRAAQLHEDFTAAPADWKIFGDSSLFQWNAADGNLQVTWDSSKPNSCFYLPLGMTLSRGDSFSIRFALRLEDLMIGSDPNKPSSFQISAGLVNLTNFADPNLFRGSGIDAEHGPRNLVEFDYFADSGFGATVAPTIISFNNQFAASFNFPLEVSVGDNYEIAMNYSAETQTLSSSLLKNGSPYGTPPNNTLDDVVLGKGFSDFAVNAFAVASYNDAGQTPPEFAGSVIAHGTIDNVGVTLPDPPSTTIHLSYSVTSVTIAFDTNPRWRYLLQRSDDLKSWTDLGEELQGNGGELQLHDPVTQLAQFYRVRLRHP